MQISIHEEVPIPLAYDFDVDGPIALASTAAWFAAASVRETIGPSRCSWCETNGFDVGVRNALRWGDPQAAEIGAIVVGFAIGPAAVLASDLAAAAHDRSWQSFLVDALLVAEAGAIASDASLAVRYVSARERPYASDWSAAERLQPHSRDANMSFYSNHTAMMFAVASSAGTIAAMRGYRWWPLVWIVGMPFAFATAYLRVASDDHWMTDVLVGMGVGAAMGFAIPYFAHKRIKLAGPNVVGTF